MGHGVSIASPVRSSRETVAPVLPFNHQLNQSEEGPCLEVLKSGSYLPLAE